jgi:superfamily II DNA or RNA helicase
LLGFFNRGGVKVPDQGPALPAQSPLLPPTEPSPLDGLSFRFPLRRYQQEILELVKVKIERGEKQLHIVAPPGAGKTIIGLQLISELKHNALVVCPTTTIQAQWGQKLDLFVPPDLVGYGIQDLIGTHEDKPLKPITLLTYQVLSTPGRELEYLQKLAHNDWVQELIGTTCQGQGDAELRIMELMQNNKRAYDKEMSRHISRLRRKLSDLIDLKEVLHPNALGLLQALRRQNFKVVIFDECHHLTDYWAAVMTQVVSRLDDAVVIGLTGTPPEGKSVKQENRYVSLIGEIDYQVPTPALVKEGGLAPFQDLVYFTEPTAREERFLELQHEEFHQLLVDLVDAEPPLLTMWVIETAEQAGRNSWRKFLCDHSELAQAIGRFIWRYKLDVPHIEMADSFRQAPLLEDWMVLLEEFALSYLKVSALPEHHKLYEKVRSAVGKLGYGLTEKGLRKKASNVDRVLAFSKSKPRAVAEILDVEYRNVGDKLRVAVVTDFERMSATSVKSAKGVLDAQSGGAIAVLREVLLRPAGLFTNPCLVTGSLLMIDARIKDQFVEAMNQLLAEDGHSFTVRAELVDEEKRKSLAEQALEARSYDAQSIGAQADVSQADGAPAGDTVVTVAKTGGVNTDYPAATNYDMHGDGIAFTGGEETPLEAKLQRFAPAPQAMQDAVNPDPRSKITKIAHSRIDFDDLVEEGESDLTDALEEAEPEQIPEYCEIIAGSTEWQARLYVGLATQLLERGITKCLIGTRGIFGEGWDCQALNTLIDLTTTTTPVSVKQLRGRSIRLNTTDPLGARKVANNWDVVCIAPHLEKGLNDYQRFARKHCGYFGISDDGQIECGVGHVHPSFSELTPAEVFAHSEEFNSEMIERALKRDQTYDLWGVGKPYANRMLGCVEVTGLRKLALTPPNIRTSVSYKDHAKLLRASLYGVWFEYGFIGLVGTGFTGATLHHFGAPYAAAGAVMAFCLAVGFRKFRLLYDKHKQEICRPNTQDSSLKDIGIAVLSALQAAKILPRTIDKGNVLVNMRSDGSYRVFLDDVDSQHAEYFVKCVREALEPISNQPYVMPKYEFAFPRPKKGQKLLAKGAPSVVPEGTQETEVSEEQFFTTYLAGRAQPRIASYHAVPSLLARSERGREAFQNAWNKYVSPGFVLATETKPELLGKYFGLGPSISKRMIWE